MKFDKLIKSNLKSYKRIRVYVDEYLKFKYAVNQKAKYESLNEQEKLDRSRHDHIEGSISIPSKQLVDYYSVQSNYWSVIKAIRSKKDTIKVAFLVVFDTVFPFWKVFESMFTDPVFDPYIVVVPNISQTHDY